MYFNVVNDKTRISNPQCQKSMSKNKNTRINKCSQEPNKILIAQSPGYKPFEHCFQVVFILSKS